MGRDRDAALALLGAATLLCASWAPPSAWARPRLAPLFAASPAEDTEREGSGAVEAPRVAAARWTPAVVRPASARPGPAHAAIDWTETALVAAAPTVERPDLTAADLDPIAHPDGPLPPTLEPPLGSLEEWVVGLRLLADTRRSLLEVADVDVLITREKRRLWPLFRVLATLRVEVEVIESDGQGPTKVRWFAKSGRRVTLSAVGQEADFEVERRPVEVVRRWSEFRREPELYLPEEILAESLGYKAEWSPQDLELRLYAPVVPDWYYAERVGPAKLDLRSIAEVPPNLPETQPPARPSENGLQFLEVSLAGNYSAKRDLKERGFLLQRPQERLWGKALGGNVRVHLSQQGFSTGDRPETDGEAFFVDRASWDLRGRRSAVTLGDAELALGEVVFPYAPLTGLRWAAGTMAKGPKLFTPEITVEDTAPLDSPVDLYVNAVRVASTRVRDPLKNLPGFGLFRFEGVALIPSRSNEIRIVVTEPSGYRREIVRQVWGSPRVLQPGEFGVLAGVGTNRSKTAWESHGILTGGLLRYGVAQALSVDLMGGYQHGIRDSIPETTGQNGAGQSPDESYHLGVGLSLVASPAGFLRVDLAQSWNEAAGDSDWALRAVGDFRAGRFAVRPDLFRYGPEYFDGMSIMTRDREGLWVGASWDVTDWLLLTGGAGSVRNDLNGNAEKRLHETIQRAELSLGGLPFASRFSLAGDFIQQRWDDGRDVEFYTAILTTRPTSELEFEGRWYAGDSHPNTGHTKLTDNLRLLDLPFYGSPYIGGRLRWRPTSTMEMSVSHWDYRTRRESLVGLTLAGNHKMRWSFASDLGRDWDRDDGALVDAIAWNNRLSLYPDGSGNRRLSLQWSFRRHEWSLLASFNLLELIGFPGGSPTAPTWLTGRQIAPSQGGVIGKVFLDVNGDGRRQEGEPGVKKVVVTMGRSTATTDGQGTFVMPLRGGKDANRVSLLVQSLDALYTPTNGTQLVEVAEGAVSTVELGIAIFGAIIGVVEEMAADGSTQPSSGVYVALFDTEGVRIKHSVTASDGSFYLGEVRPGVYWVQVDETNLPAGLAVKTPPQRVAMASGIDEPIDQRVDFTLARAKKDGPARGQATMGGELAQVSE